MAFGDVVRARRTALLISLNDMAERLGISPGYWSRVERGIEFLRNTEIAGEYGEHARQSLGTIRSRDDR
ncbi:MAG: helix-turn-helix domain-containing protein, partial [Alphaproteobacteria bacterium]